MALKLPVSLPARYQTAAGSSASISPVDTGGYDILVGGLGFRYATNQDFPFKRTTEPTTINRVDQSLEPGEQTLSKLPWIKSQSSFHAGAGQQNLEAPFTAFQYQQEQVAHIRYDTSLGVDPWTPGKVSRLADTTYQSFGFAAQQMVTASVNDVDYAILGGQGSLYRVAWLSGPDAAPTVTAIDLTGATFGGASNCNVVSLTTDGNRYFAILQLTTVGSTAGVLTYVISGSVNSVSAPTPLYNASASVVTGVLGWAKERLMAGLANNLYDLDTGATVVAHTALPSPRYTHPSPTWTWTAVAESPDSILASGATGNQASIMKLLLDTSGVTPTLAGAVSCGSLPLGEIINEMQSYLGTFVALGTNKGVRVASFDTYSGNVMIGPLSLATTQPVYGLAGNDRFVYAGYSNQQADGSTGLARIDLTLQIDSSGRLAWAPDLRPPSTAPTGRGTVNAVSTLPLSGRLLFLTTEGLHTQKGTPGNDPNASYWLRTSRIRFNTSEPKLFKLGAVRGTLDTSSVTVTGLTPFNGTTVLGTFGPVVGGNPGNFRLPAGLNEWIQLQFGLNGSACVFNSYQAKAIPAPNRQHLIQFSVSLYYQEMDRGGNDVTEALTPRQRYAAVKALEAAGNEIVFTEFTATGAESTRVVIDDTEFVTTNRPTDQEDFAGILTFRLRETES